MRLETASQADVFQEECTQAQPSREFEVGDDDRGWRLQRNQLESIAASDEIRCMLKDPELQKLITKVDNSSVVEQVCLASRLRGKITVENKDLNEAMKAPVFQEFADKILSILNPEQQ